jgi:hypothetical protein
MKSTYEMFMNLVKSALLLMVTITFCQASFAIEKKAILIGIGDYPEDGGWQKTSGDNDVSAMEKSIKSIGFNNITKLVNKQATKSNIISELQHILDSCQPGDIVLFYFAGHGQLIQDFNADEYDGYDESLVLYNAPKEYDALYKNESHLLDDELSEIINNFRIVLGSKGEFISIIDAGFGWSTDDANDYVRGGAKPLEAVYQTHPFKNIGLFEAGIIDDQPFSIPSNGHANLFHLSANMISKEGLELNGNGILTLAFTRSLEELDDSSSYEDWAAMVSKFSAEISTNQTIQMEGDAEQIVFDYYRKINGSDFETFHVQNTNDTMTAQEQDMLQNISNIIKQEYNMDPGSGEFGSSSNN